MPRPRRAGLFIVLAAALVASSSFQGCSGDGPTSETQAALNALLAWNRIAIDASGLDHEQGTVEQLGPCRSARALAIVHIAMFEAMIAMNGGFQSILNLPNPGVPISQRVAIAQAAHDALASLFPTQAMTGDFAAALQDELDAVQDIPRKNAGIALGQAAASGILGMRFNDGSQIPETQVFPMGNFVCSDQPGFWRMDPISQIPAALGCNWNQVLPFTMTSASQFRTPAPPAMSSLAYELAYNEVKTLGGDGLTTPTTRTQDQTVAGIYWAYDGTPSLGAPPRLYNQIAVLLGHQQDIGYMEFGRLLALVNVAMADAGLACWESKYFYQVWRPVAGIREADPGTGPSMLGDGNPNTVGDVNFSPLGAPKSNTTGPNFTPPFPAYPSGHATFGGALFQVLRRFFGTDGIPFTFVSDEFNGVTLDVSGNPRPLIHRSFSTFSQAEDENGQSRIYLGIHWAFDKTEGITQGNDVGNWTFDHVYQPLP
jgi:hypothetical protein